MITGLGLTSHGYRRLSDVEVDVVDEAFEVLPDDQENQNENDQPANFAGGGSRSLLCYFTDLLRFFLCNCFCQDEIG